MRLGLTAWIIVSPPLYSLKRGENMEQWLSVISDVGFPIIVTLYLLNRIESKLDTLNQSIQMLPSQIHVL